MSQSSGIVYLVGAGPGDPGLMTLRGVECLSQADVILYDYLVNPRLLEYAPPHAEKVPLGDPETGRKVSQEDLERKLIALAREGKTVVRLKGGDPFIFGRGGEEAQALREAGVAYEIVPGVTAGIAAPTYAGIPLTHRDHASTVVFATAHEDPAKPESRVQWDRLAQIDATLVFYMGVGRIEELAQALISAGKNPQTPAAVVAWGTWPQQQTVAEPLQRIAAAAREMSVTAPAVIVVGSVAQFRPLLRWFEDRPLFGQRIMVTRPEDQGRQLAARLEALGAETWLLPTIRIQPPRDWGPVDHAINRLEQFAWLVFTSANGVTFFLERLKSTGGDLRRLGHLKLAAIGPGTRQTLAQYHLQPDIMPSQYRAEQLAAELVPHVRGKRVLLARANRGRKVLPERLAAAGAQVEQIAVYETQDVTEADPEVLERLRAGRIDWITLTSSAITRSLARLLDEEVRGRLGREVQLVSISPVTTQTAKDMGLEVAAEAKSYTIEGVVQTLMEACHSIPSQRPRPS